MPEKQAISATVTGNDTRVRVLDRDSEEFQIAARRLVAGRGSSMLLKLGWPEPQTARETVSGGRSPARLDRNSVCAGRLRSRTPELAHISFTL